jgi:homocitrate synthase
MAKTLAFIETKAKEVINYVKAHSLEIRFSGEDSFRTDFAEIVKLYSTLDQLGLDRVGIADSGFCHTDRSVPEDHDAASGRNG